MSSFVVFGNLETPFERMALAIKATYALFPKPLLIQAGANYDQFVGAPRGVEVFRLCSFSDFSQIIQSSTVIVTHGGVGSVKETVLSGLRPAVFVRQGSKGEHIDDHQVDWCNLLFSAQLATEVSDAHDLSTFLTNAAHTQLDMIKVRKFCDDSKLKLAVHDFIRDAIQARRARL